MELLSRVGAVTALALLTAACAPRLPAPTTPPETTAAPQVATSERFVVGCGEDPHSPGTFSTCELDGYPDRPYDVFLPASRLEGTGLPVILAVHGGGGNRLAAGAVTCPTGDLRDEGCLHGVGNREGFISVYPDGLSARAFPALRTWNAGGGTRGFRCVSGRACREQSDDVAYLAAVLDDLLRWYPADPRRMYATGLSNGGAMSYRLACELSDRVAAIAPVGAGNQLGAAQECAPVRPVPVLHIHGTDDPCWAYEGGTSSCSGDQEGVMVSVDETISQWVTINRCDPTPIRSDLPDSVEDGMTSYGARYEECAQAAEILLITVEGGGHTWPGGLQYLPVRRIGPVTRDFNASQVIWEFLSTHRLG